MPFLTKLEELFMLAVFHLEEPVGLGDIRDYLLDKTGKDWAFGSLYVALDKLKKGGLVESYKGEPQHVRGGKARRFYRLTQPGVHALEEAWSIQADLWRNFTAGLKSVARTDEK